MKKTVCLIWVLALLFFLTCAGAEQGYFALQQINVGCSNAYLIQCDDYTIMVDGGYNDKVTPHIVMDYLALAQVNRIDAFFCTHWHDDHAGNMDLILDTYGDARTKVYGSSDRVMEKWLPLPAGTYSRLYENDVLTYGALTVKCLGPFRLEGFGGVNHDSLNLLFTYGNRRFMINGDYMHSKPMIDNHLDEIEEVDVYQFPHHGIKPYCVDLWAVRRIHPSYIIVPGAGTWNTRMEFAEGGVQAEWVDNGSGHFAFVTDGESLELFRFLGPDTLPVLPNLEKLRQIKMEQETGTTV